MTKTPRTLYRILGSRLRALLGSEPAAPVALVGSPRPGPLRDQVRASEAVLRRLLEHNVLPFWYPRALDEENGGYLVHHDRSGKWMGPAPKHLVVQARTLWFFSRLARSGFGERYLEAAASGFAFLRDCLWDGGGGFYWAVDHKGCLPATPDKRAYGQAFGLFAIAEYAAASGEPDALRLARATWEYLERWFHDARAGGYFSRLEAPLPAGSAGSGGVKSYNDHLHLLEALTAFWQIEPTPPVRERALETILILSSAVLRKRDGACTESHGADWAPSEAIAVARTSYGHDVEGAWLLLDSCDALGIPPALLTDHAVTMVTTMLKYGFDHRRGGVYAGGPLGARADDRRKIWWIQAEALVACLDLYVRSGLPAAGEAYLSILEWIVTVQADWQVGEWHEVVLPTGQPAGDKAGPWKGPYHSGRAMLVCLDRLRRLADA